MLQELARDTGGSGWAIASLLFFLAVWLAVAVRVWRASPEEMAAQASLPLSSDGGADPAPGADSRA